MDVRKTFGIKDSSTKHIPSAEFRADPEFEYSSFTNAHRLNMARLVRDCSRRICEIVCPGNAQALLDEVAGALSESHPLKQRNERDRVEHALHEHEVTLESAGKRWKALESRESVLDGSDSEHSKS